MARPIRALLFDFDGVIADSVDIKTEAFRELFKDESRANLERILKYHQLHGGVSRTKKFEYFYKNILRRPLTGFLLERLSEQFACLVKEKVVKAPFIDGAEEFLKKYSKTLDLYIVSGTPHEELTEIILRKGIAGYFVKVYGFPPSKSEIILSLIDENNYSSQEVYFIGDSLDDAESARRSGIPFIHMSASRCDKRLFKDEGLVIAGDFHELERITGCRRM